MQRDERDILLINLNLASSRIRVFIFNVTSSPLFLPPLPSHYSKSLNPLISEWKETKITHLGGFSLSTFIFFFFRVLAICIFSIIHFLREVPTLGGGFPVVFLCIIIIFFLFFFNRIRLRVHDCKSITLIIIFKFRHLIARSR